MTPPIRLLHLSDIHFRTGAAWDSDPVLRALASFIGQDVQAGLIPDLIVITGDLGFSGKAAEYALARIWLEQELWPVLSQDPAKSLPRDRLLLVPGNHDVDRDAVNFLVKAAQDRLLTGKDQQQVAKVLAAKSQRQVLLKRHAAYQKFYKDWLGRPQPLPWWQRTFDIHGQSLHVAGLDSAWMACGDQDRGRLLLGRYQINQTALSKEAEGAQWRLALLHHPWDYLAEFEAQEARQQIYLHRDLVLRGHLHEGEVALVRAPDPKRSCLELAAGCVYESSRYPNAFHWIELHSDPRRVRILFRCWNKGAWQVDRNQPNCPDGQAEIPLDAPEPPPPGGRTATAKPVLAIPGDYLAWLRRTYGGIDLLGQDLQQGRSLTLSQVYCPAVTLLATPPDPSSPCDLMKSTG
jgi:predicted MPP superfamily phosphohydrolase